MSLLNLNNDPPNVSAANMALSERFASQAIPSRVVPMFDRDQGKMVMTEFDFGGNFKKANEYMKRRMDIGGQSFPFSREGKADGMLYSEYIGLPQEEQDAMLRGVVDNVVSSLGNLRSEYRMGTRGVGKVKESSGGLPMYNNIVDEIGKLGDKGKRFARAIRGQSGKIFGNKTDNLIAKIREQFGDKGLQKVVNNVPDLKMYIDLVRGARVKD